MKRNLSIILLISMLAAGCAKITTASEPQFDSISTRKTTSTDQALYAELGTRNPTPADRLELAVAIENFDLSTLPPSPTQPLTTYQVGDTRTFWTHNNDTFEFNQVTAQLMTISGHAYFWQDTASLPMNGQGVPATPEDWLAAGESFDTTYELVRAVFGNEPSPGLDGDPRLFIIHSDSLGKVGGYFGQADLLPAAIESHSNEGEYFFISNTWSSGIASEYYKEVLAHEFQHMIQKTVDPNEDGWLNEGMSMLAQQVAGMRGDNSVADFLVKPDLSLWYWDSKPSDYGQAFLFV